MSISTVLLPITALVQALLVAVHGALSASGLDPRGGVTWLLAVAVLVVIVRTALLPLVVRQQRSAQRMRALAPELRRIRDRHAGTGAGGRDALARETASLYREHGVHPLGSCLPLLVQLPLFLALVQALEQAARSTGPAALASFATAAVLGAPLAATALSGGLPATITGVALLALTAGAQVWTQHLAAIAAGPASAVPGGRLLLALPLVTAVSGLFFPIGVTAYWCCTALWSLGQQAVLIRTSARGAG